MPTHPLDACIPCSSCILSMIYDKRRTNGLEAALEEWNEATGAPRGITVEWNADFFEPWYTNGMYIVPNANSY